MASIVSINVNVNVNVNVNGTKAAPQFMQSAPGLLP